MMIMMIKVLKLKYLLIFPANQRREADDERQHPQPPDKRLCSLPAHDAGVADGPSHGHVAVQGDGAQI
jgi:hypothetical protein